MSAAVQIVALVLGLFEFVGRLLIVAVLVVSLVGLLLLVDDLGDLLTPYLWRKALR